MTEVSLQQWSDRFLAVLSEAQKERPQRDALTERPDGLPELEWVAYERGVMHEEVNRVRRERGLDPVPLAAVERAEGLAVGHVDYSRKFALNCALLALGVTDAAGRRQKTGR
jgi:hypothetical protein